MSERAYEWWKKRSCTRKKRYSTKSKAIRKASRARKPLRFYRCCFCSGWHLTSQAKEAVA